MTFTEVHFPAWVSPTLLAVACLAGVLVFLALCWDWLRRGRLKGTRRCPKCWYDMTGAGLVCPECGKVARRERDLRRSRRHIVWAVVLMLVGGASLAARWLDGKSAQQVAAAMPTDVLLAIVEEPVRALRYWSRAYSVNTPAPPGFDEWAAAELWLRDCRGLLSGRQRRALAARQAAFDRFLEITVRGSWPRGVPMTALCSPWFEGVRPRGLRAVSAWPGADVLTERSRREMSEIEAGVPRWGNGTDWSQSIGPNSRTLQEVPGVMVSLGMPPEGATEAGMEVSVTEGDEVIWTGRVSEPVRLVGSIDEAVPPVEDAAVTADLTKAFGEGFVVDGDGRGVQMTPKLIPAAGVMAAVRVEVVKGGVVLGACSLLAGASVLPSKSPFGGLPPEVVFGTLEGPGVPLTREALEGAVVRVTADPELALRLVRWDRYWRGTFEVALDPKREGMHRRW